VLHQNFRVANPGLIYLGYNPYQTLQTPVSTPVFVAHLRLKVVVYEVVSCAKLRRVGLLGAWAFVIPYYFLITKHLSFMYPDAP
jgi:hypothetical protein